MFRGLFLPALLVGLDDFHISRNLLSGLGIGKNDFSLTCLEGSCGSLGLGLILRAGDYDFAILVC